MLVNGLRFWSGVGMAPNRISIALFVVYPTGSSGCCVGSTDRIRDDPDLH